MDENRDMRQSKMKQLSKILWKPKVGDRVVSNNAFLKEFGYEIRGTIKSLKRIEGARSYLGICFHKDGIEYSDVGWFRKVKP